jgi:hypothetical protein
MSAWPALALAATILSVQANTLRADYDVSLMGLPIGVANLQAQLTPSTYAIDAKARLSGLATVVSNSRGASTGTGLIVDGKVEPSSFATTASTAKMTRTIRMAIAGNAVKRVDIAPPFEDKPDRIPLAYKDTHGVIDPIGAFVIPAPKGADPTSPAACNRTLPVFDGWTRFDLTLSYVGQRNVKAKGYAGPVAICAVRYTPIAGHRTERPATKFMAENKDMEVWLAPVEGVGLLAPFRVSVRTMIGTAVMQATEFSVVK